VIRYCFPVIASTNATHKASADIIALMKLCTYAAALQDPIRMESMNEMIFEKKPCIPSTVMSSFHHQLPQYRVVKSNNSILLGTGYPDIKHNLLSPSLLLVVIKESHIGRISQKSRAGS
jgi:hypothetical protein